MKTKNETLYMSRDMLMDFVKQYPLKNEEDITIEELFRFVEEWIENYYREKEWAYYV